jgi:DNA-binding CsgD family transcriptional regulator
MAARAARLLGADEVLRERVGTPVLGAEREHYERDLAAARRGLSEDGFATAWAEGRTLSLEEAVAEADAVFAAVIAGETAPDQPAPAHGLSPREREVVALIAAGRSNQEIADALFISHRTATTHVRNILTKLDLPSRTAVAAWAIRHGLA